MQQTIDKCCKIISTIVRERAFFTINYPVNDEISLSFQVLNGCGSCMIFDKKTQMLYEVEDFQEELLAAKIRQQNLLKTVQTKAETYTKLLEEGKQIPINICELKAWIAYDHQLGISELTIVHEEKLNQYLNFMRKYASIGQQSDLQNQDPRIQEKRYKWIQEQNGDLVTKVKWKKDKDDDLVL